MMETLIIKAQTFANYIHLFSNSVLYNKTYRRLNLEVLIHYKDTKEGCKKHLRESK